MRNDFARWTGEEDTVAERFAQEILKGRYPKARSAIADCRRALARRGLWPHSDSAIFDKLRKRARELGVPSLTVYWTPAEEQVIERFSRALVDGRYSALHSALADCRRSLAKVSSGHRRTDYAIRIKLGKRSCVLGRKRSYVRWTPGEDRIVDRYSRAIVDGTYRDAGKAVPDCRRELRKAGFLPVRDRTSVRLRLFKRSVMLGRSPSSPRWRPAENRVIERFAHGLVAGRYADQRVAAADCQKALGRIKSSPGHSDSAVASRLYRRARALGHIPKLARWTEEENRVARRFARDLTEGRHLTTRKAAVACADVLASLSRRTGRQAGRVRVRDVDAVVSRLRKCIPKPGPILFRGQLTAPEQEIVDWYARAVLSHKYRSIRQAAALCCKAINRLGRSGRRGKKRGRTELDAYYHLRKHACEMNRLQLPFRRWTIEERQVLTRWSRTYDQHVRGKLRMNLATISGLMQAELNRLGYYRTVYACRTAIVARRIALA